MAQTDPNDILESQRSGRRWSFAGMLEGIRASFGIGGKQIVTASANAATQAIQQAGNLEILLAKKYMAREGTKYWSRMSLSEAKLKMWRNDFLTEIDLKLRENFHPQNFNRMTLMKHSSTNLLQRIVNDISITYENPPRRYFKEDVTDVTDKVGGSPEPGENEPPVIPDKTKAPAPGGPPEPGAPPAVDTGTPEIDALANELDLEGAEEPLEDDVLRKLAEHSNLDMVMENVERYARFLPCVWIRPMVEYENVLVTKKVDEKTGDSYDETSDDPASGELHYIVYTPDMADVVTDPNNPNEIVAFWYFSYDIDARGEMVKFINFWTDASYIRLDSEWRVVDIQENPYGEIPVIGVRLGMAPNCYYVDGQGDDIYEASLELCVLKTIQNCRARDSGFKQLAISGSDPKDVPADQVLGGPTPFYTGDGGSVSVLDMEPNLDQWTAVCTSRGIEMAAKYGISAASYKTEGEPQSGFAKKLDMGRILSINRRGRKYFRKAEIELYKLTQTILKVRPVPAIGVLPDRTLEIDFAEPTFDEDPKSQAVTDAQRIALNIDSIIDILKRENPDLSEVELLKLAAKKKKINDAFIAKSALTLLDLLATSGPKGQKSGGAGVSKSNPTDGNPNAF